MKFTRNNFLDAFKEVLDSGEGDTFKFDGVKMKINDPVGEPDNGYVKFKIFAEADFEMKVYNLLNKINFEVDGAVEPANPQIFFLDDTPGSPGTISDKFAFSFSGINTDLINL